MNRYGHMIWIFSDPYRTHMWVIVITSVEAAVGWVYNMYDGKERVKLIFQLIILRGQLINNKGTRVGFI